jgi:hypothetical protein
MSLRQQVATLIDEIGPGTVDDIMPEIKGYTRAQVVKALHNAAQIGLISCDGRGKILRNQTNQAWQGSRPGPYRSGRKAPAGVPKAPNSVFQLSAFSGPLTRRQSSSTAMNAMQTAGDGMGRHQYKEKPCTA